MKKRTRRRAWNPLANPVRAAVVAAQPPDLTTIKTANLMTLREVRAGRIDRHGIQVLEAIVGTSESLARVGVGTEALPVCAAARRALKAIAAARGKVGKLEVAAFEVLIEFYDAQVDAASQGEVARAVAPYVHLRR
ncbi:hypothetical protein [Ramlibacter rhizophilus]|uniref:Uncharacterized protein n=1 Tax=Ramlibacter rhizophilus TaxID=1781167 RepID=A0A4Z0BGX9_9BURK|nr:hypothetical protein [Ramlibacter rhizophilus]TFY97517.1 hypothetical protein EZ242_18545 [Ramlibacter rhizophilus]